MKSKTLLTKGVLALNILVLSFIFMVFGYAHVKKAEASVAIDYSNDVDYSYANNLRFGYDVTGGTALFKNNSLNLQNPILKKLNETNLTVTKSESNPELEGESYAASNMRDLALQVSDYYSAGIEAKVAVVNTDISTTFSKMNLQEEAYSERYEIYVGKYAMITYMIEGKPDFREYLDEQFKRDLLSIKTVDDAMLVLNEYGTHLLTGHVYGGLLEASNYIASTQSNISTETVEKLETKLETSFSKYSAGASVDFNTEVINGEKQIYEVSEYKCSMYGGKGSLSFNLDQLFDKSDVAIGQNVYQYDKWTESLDVNQKNLALIETPAKSRKIAIWELLPDNGYNDVRSKLLEAYKIKCGDKYDAFLEAYPPNPRSIFQSSSGVEAFKTYGYSTVFRGNVTYHEFQNNDLEYTLNIGSELYMHSQNAYEKERIEWIVTGDGKDYVEIIDNKNGIFKVKDNAVIGRTIKVGLVIDGDYSDPITYGPYKIARGTFSGGTGTEKDPYLISNQEDLITLANNENYWSSHFLLTADIDFNNASFKGIGTSGKSFDGTFDGNYFTIKNVNTVDYSENAVGIFKYNAGTIKNLYVDNFTFDVYNNSDITKEVKYLGSIVGCNKGTIDNCKATNIRIKALITLDVNSFENETLIEGYAGGLVGYSVGVEGQAVISKCIVSNIAVGLKVVKVDSLETGKNINIESSIAALVGKIDNTSVSNSHVSKITIVQGYVDQFRSADICVSGFVGNMVNNSSLSVGIISNSDGTQFLSGGKSATEKRNVAAIVARLDSTSSVSNCTLEKIATPGSNGDYFYPSGVSADNCQVVTKATYKTAKLESNSLWCENSDGSFELVSQKFDPNDVIDIVPLRSDESGSAVKVVYAYGEKFSVAGLILQYKFATNKNEPYDLSVFTYDESNYDPYEIGTHVIYLHAIGQVYRLEVRVRPLDVIGIDIQKKDPNKVYYEGDYINSDDFTAQLILENGERIDPYAEKLSYVNYNGLDLSNIKFNDAKYVLGENEIVATLGTVKGSLIVSALEKQVLSVELKKEPTKKVYRNGEEFIISGLEVYATYNSDPENPVLIDNSLLEIIGNIISSGENVVYLSLDHYNDNNVVEVKVIGLEVYTIIFQDYDGTVLSETKYNDGDLVVTPENPMRESDEKYHYEFKGWDKEVSDVAKESVVYTAIYEKTLMEYTVTFKNYNGDIISSRSYKYGDTIVKPENPTRNNDNIYEYHFTGWDKEVEMTCTSNVTYIAQYESDYIDYFIVFKDYDDSIISSKEYHYGDIIEVPANPTRESDNKFNYKFKSWDKNVSTTCKGSVEYTAIYNETYIEYTVVFKDYDGTELSNETYHYGDIIEVPANPIRESDNMYTYQFKGWNKVVSPTCKGSVEYTAVYTQQYIEYTVVFKDYDGKELSKEIYHYGDDVEVPANPTRESDNMYTYQFKGWNKVVSPTCKGNAEYTAIYTPIYINYTVVFKDYDGTILSSKTYHYGDTILVLENPTRLEDNVYKYQFSGWDKVVDTTCKDDVEYTAIYIQSYIEYAVVFKDYDGTILSSKTYYYGAKIEIPENPTREDESNTIYEFTGWDKTVNTTCTESIEYTAKYSKVSNEYTVVFKDYNGTILSSNKYVAGEVINIPSNPTREDDNMYSYTFKGWDKTVQNICTSDIEYTATYTLIFIEYSIVFKDYDGEIISSNKYHYDEEITIPEDPLRLSDNTYMYTFKGWTQVVSPTCKGDVEYTAVYTKSYVEYLIVFKDSDGQVLSSGTYHYGDYIVVISAPTKEGYKFIGWDKAVSEVCRSSVEYTAKYELLKIYTVVFKDYDGEIISSNTYNEGEYISIPSNPQRVSDEVYSYKFIGWDKTILEVCNANMVYEARYETTYIEYKVSFIVDGEIIAANTYHYNDVINYPINPTKEGYTFTGWDKDIKNVNGNIEFNAMFSKNSVNNTKNYGCNGSVISMVSPLISLGVFAVFLGLRRRKKEQ